MKVLKFVFLNNWRRFAQTIDKLAVNLTTVKYFTPQNVFLCENLLKSDQNAGSLILRFAKACFEH